MYLKRLELLGFKSFADKIKLDFRPGVTAVVGPNGSGKSNISDALRWVLGEQSIKSLRGSKMDDLIFAGTELRKALGLAEVTMVLDNFDHAIPLDFEEVSITRRLFRSGESEYLINKSPVRLRDIHELFYDTGLGKDAYSVISQGKIDSILSVKAEERRLIFEEAAGIIKYKSRKSVTERKLQDTDGNLVRVRDIINELQSQLEPLQAQAKLAEDYLSLKERLSNVEINHYHRILGSLSQEVLAFQQSKVETEAHFRDFEGEASLVDAQLEEIRLQLLNLDHQINRLSEAYFGTQNTIDKGLERVGFLETKINDCRRQALEYDQGLNLNGKRQETVQIEKEQLESEIRAITSRIAAEREELRDEEASLTACQEQLKAWEVHEQNLKNELIDVLNKIASLKNKQDSSTLQKNFLSKQADECRRKQVTLSSQHEMLRQEAENKEHILQDALGQIDDLQRSRADLLLKGKALQQDIMAMEEKNQEERQRIRSLEGKIGVFEDMEKSFQGYFQGVKVLLAEAAGEGFRSKIRGIVADLITVKPGMELALETALGSSLQHIVIEDDQAAQDAIAFLKRKAKGRATFLPLNRVRAADSRMQSISGLLKQYACHPATSLLEFNLDYQQIVNYLLSQVVVAPNLKVAIQLSGHLDRGFRIVTPEGDLVNPGGSITGGSNERQRVGLLSRKREIEDLQLEKSRLESSLHQGLQECAQKKELLKTYDERIETLKNAENEWRLTKVSLTGDLETARKSIRRLEEEVDLLQDQLLEYEDESIKFDSGTEEAGHAIEESELLLKQIEAELARVAQTLEASKQDKDGRMQKITDLKSKLSADLQELNGKDVLKQRLDNQLAEADDYRQEMRDKQAELRALQQQIEADLADSGRQVDLHKHTLVEQQTQIAAEKTLKETLQTKVRDLEDKQRSFRRRNSDFQTQLHRLDLAITQKSKEKEHIGENLVEAYGLEWETHVVADWEEPANAAALIEELKASIRALGPVNVAAITDYRQVKERAEFLNVQAQDLEKARSALEKVIAEIERTIEKRFLETFDQIRKEFKKIFSELFSGGSADLYLLEPHDKLESGIEIVAQPPGKKLQSLSLLSGGERAMTAIALLFAILTIKPAPFCILDEIDATLDEVNVQRFSKLLELFSEQLQFVVVTHRRGTMEAANTLYGVTMEEMGISKLISLNLNEKAV